MTKEWKKDASERSEDERKVARAISNEDVEEVVLSKRRTIDAKRDVRMTADDLLMYLWPACYNFESVDAMGAPNGVFN